MAKDDKKPEVKKVKEERKPKKVKIKILTHAMAGKYLRAENFGDVVEMEEKQAMLIVDNGDAQLIG